MIRTSPLEAVVKTSEPASWSRLTTAWLGWRSVLKRPHSMTEMFCRTAATNGPPVAASLPWSPTLR